MDYNLIRGYGGVCVFWRKEINSCVKVCEKGSDIIIILEIETNRNPICLVNNYMPSTNTKKLNKAHNKSDKDLNKANEEYMSMTSEISEILETYRHTHNIIICGDMNASITRNTTRDLLFQNFIQDAGLTPTPKQSSKYTFFHHNGKSQSQIDYFLFNEHHLPDINKIETHEMKPKNCSDHVPISLSLNTTLVKYKVKAKQNKVMCRTN
ncbi:hypothetical protein DPMN_065322 [Dreissena polymorpha]|uniref:Endonuclease/exonuclease/phosphatase domain-containing protein n=1 Tax=Dreissena polymorpha TaxID=45954 RepID=A0A9D4CET8_DREPO|nr:hypothetical protein DPMN_065322 [Dreissena polymorpha]